MQEGTREKHRARFTFEALAQRIYAIERLILETPAQSLDDAVAQMIIMLPGLDDTDGCDRYTRGVASSLAILIPTSSADFGELIKHYAAFIPLAA